MKKLIYILLPLFLLSACKKDKNGLEGSLEGKVVLISVNGKVYPGQENVHVTAREGLLNKGLSSSATTNRYGYYKLGNLWSGLYDVNFSREGFGIQTERVNFVGGDVPQQLNTNMYEIPENVFSSFKLSVNSDYNLKYEYTSVDSIEGSYTLQLYLSFSYSPDFGHLVSDKIYHVQEFYKFNGDLSLSEFFSLPIDRIRDQFFPEGGKIYIVACLGNGYESIYSSTALRVISDPLEIDLPSGK